MSLITTQKILLYLWLLTITAFSVAAEKPYSSPMVEELIKIEDERLVYKGKSVPVPYSRERLIKVFGKPSREIYNTAGTVVIWDELGLSCYGCQEQEKTPEEFQFMSKEEKASIKPQEYVESITLFVRKYNPYPDREKKYSHEPRYPFPGKLELEGVELDGTLSFYEFVENREGKQTILLPENSFSFFIRCKPKPHEVTLHTIRDKYNDDYMSIYSVSIRNIGQYYKNITCTEKFSVAPRPKDPDEEAPLDNDQAASSPAQQDVPAADTSPPEETLPSKETNSEETNSEAREEQKYPYINTQ
jgi:hypothetical protein